MALLVDGAEKTGSLYGETKTWIDLSSPSMLSSGTSSLLAGCQSRETLYGTLGAPLGYQGPGHHIRR